MADGRMREGMDGVLLRFLGPGMKQVIPTIILNPTSAFLMIPSLMQTGPPQTDPISNASAESRSFSNISNQM
jgi:hypothetical protein